MARGLIAVRAPNEHGSETDAAAPLACRSTKEGFRPLEVRNVP